MATVVRDSHHGTFARFTSPSGSTVLQFTVSGGVAGAAPVCRLSNLNGSEPSVNFPRRCAGNVTNLVEWPGVPAGTYEVAVYGNGDYRSEIFGPIAIP